MSRHRLRTTLTACLLLVVAAVGTSAAPAKARIPEDAKIEAIAFDGIAMSERAAILDRIGVAVGDRLDTKARQRIGQRLNPAADVRLFSHRDRGLTFSDRPGSKPDTVVLVISLGC
jgi:hypothetical protein